MDLAQATTPTMVVAAMVAEVEHHPTGLEMDLLPRLSQSMPYHLLPLNRALHLRLLPYLHLHPPLLRDLVVELVLKALEMEPAPEMIVMTTQTATAVALAALEAERIRIFYLHTRLRTVAPVLGQMELEFPALVSHHTTTTALWATAEETELGMQSAVELEASQSILEDTTMATMQQETKLVYIGGELTPYLEHTATEVMQIGITLLPHLQ